MRDHPNEQNANQSPIAQQTNQGFQFKTPSTYNSPSTIVAEPELETLLDNSDLEGDFYRGGSAATSTANESIGLPRLRNSQKTIRGYGRTVLVLFGFTLASVLFLAFATGLSTWTTLQGGQYALPIAVIVASSLVIASITTFYLGWSIGWNSNFTGQSSR